MRGTRPSSPTEREALALLRKRDPRGFDLAYAAYAERIHAFVRRLAGDPDLADDLLQHTFLRLAERGQELRPDSDLRAWLFRVARNAFLDQARLRGANRETGLEVLTSHDPNAEARLMLGDVERALAALRLPDRELLLLVGVEGLTPQQAAIVLGIDAVALRQRLARARARLLTELERDQTTERLREGNGA